MLRIKKQALKLLLWLHYTCIVTLRLTVLLLLFCNLVMVLQSAVGATPMTSAVILLQALVYAYALILIFSWACNVSYLLLLFL